MIDFKRKLLYGSIVFVVLILVTGSLVYARDYNAKHNNNSNVLVDSDTINADPVYEGMDIEGSELQYAQQSDTQSNVRAAYSYNILNQLKNIVYSDGRRITYSYDSNGNQLTMEVDTAPSTTKTTYLDAFLYPYYPTTIDYHQGGYIGTMSKMGSPYVISGSIIPSEYRNISEQCLSIYHFNYNSQGHAVLTTVQSCPSTIYYSQGGFSGNLYRTDTVTLSPCSSYGTPNSICTQRSYINYFGIVIRPEIDTRVWRQDYFGTVYQI